MLSLNNFHSYTIKNDPYLDEVPSIKLDDLPPRYEGKIKLSYMMSTFNRKAQLLRTLESLCRQSFKEFEVLINNDGSSQDIEDAIKTFEPYLNLRYYFTPRNHWISCSSKAYKRMLPYCEGEVIAIAHPEMILAKDATYYLYYGAIGILNDLVLYSHLDDYNVAPTDSDKLWVTLKPQFIEKDQYIHIDEVDWHKDIYELKKLPNFNNQRGFAYKPNFEWAVKERCPWWFVGSAKRSLNIWDDMPEFEGHATLDMWLLKYRGVYKYVDCNTILPTCFHQCHATSAVAPEGEQEKAVVK